MLRVLKNNKGMTLTEVITALAILGIISIPLIAVFSNSVLITHMTKKQMEINAVMQIVKREVAESVKNGVELLEFENPDEKVNLSPAASEDPGPYSPVDGRTEFLKIQSGNLTESYKYRVKYIDKGDGTVDISKPEPGTVVLAIELYTSDGKKVSDLKTDILYGANTD